MRILFKIVFSYSLMLFFLYTNINAQQPQLRFRHLTQENGLKNSNVYCFDQDANGFIWIGTEGGLFRYDGFRFKAYNYDPADSNSLNSNVVFTILVQPEGKIWIGTYKGLMLYNESSDRFIDFNLSDKYLPNQPVPVNKIVKAPGDEIWIGAQDIGILIYNTKTQTFDEIKSGRINRLIKNNSVSSLFFDSKNDCWISTISDGVYKCSYDGTRVKAFNFMDYFGSNPICNEVLDVYESKTGEIWIATRGCGIFHLVNERIKNYTYDARNENSLGSNEVYDFWEDKSGLIWISTSGGGINIYNPKTDKFSRIKHRTNDKYSLLNDNIRASFEDNQGNLWLSSFQAGVNIHINTPYKFNHFLFSTEESTEYKSSTALSFYKDKDVVWVGTDGGGLKKISRSTGNVVTYLPGDSYIPDRVVMTIYKDYQGIYWLGTYLNGLVRFTPSTGEFYSYTHKFGDDQSLSYNYVTSIMEDKNGNFWVGTNGGGLNLFDKTTNKFTVFKSSETDLFNSIVSNYVNVLQEDYNGEIWIGTYWGLSRFNVRDFSFRNYLCIRHELGCLSDNVVLSMLRDSRDRLWVGTRMGLNLYDREKDNFTVFTENDGLAGNTINGILEDGNGNLWISTDNGISLFNPTLKSIINFSAEDGLQGNEFFRNSCFKSLDGELFFGGYNGFNSFHPDSIIERHYEPKVVITELQILDKEIPIGPASNGRTILEKNITQTTSLDLRYSDKSITLSFSAIDFIEGAKNVYAYKLDGFDEDWKFTSREHAFATYTNLSPGYYKLLIKAGKRELIDSIKTYTTLSIRIRPPVWRTWWAYAIYLFIVVYLVYYFWRLSIQRLQERNEIKIEKMKREQVESVTQARMVFYTNISHEIRTPLTLIIGPLEQLLRKGKEIQPYKKQLDIMLKNARRLLRLINQLLDFRKIEMQKMQLKAEYADIVRFIRDIVYSFEEYAVEKNIEFKFLSQTETCKIWFDPDKMDKIMFNLLSNAFKYTPDKGKISVEIKNRVMLGSVDDMKFVEIIVSDSGKGIPQKDIDKVFERFFQGRIPENGLQQGWGIGLSLTKAFVEQHKGKIFVDSIENAGSIFKVYFPLGDDHLTIEERTLSDEPVQNKYIHLSATGLSDGRGKAEKDPIPVKPQAYNILIVEDNLDLREYMMLELSEVYNCFEATNGKEGYEMAIKLMPDLIMSDILMPIMDGRQLCRSIKENIITNHIPVILLTAKTETEDQIEGFEAGADAYVMKPFRADQLIASINSIIENRRRIRDKLNILGNHSKSGSHNTVEDRFISKIDGIINKNLAESKFGVNELAQELGMSRVHLHRKLKAIADIGPNEYIRKIRLQKAAQLLLKKELPISEISTQVGFSSTTYFSSCFKEHFNLSPREYMEREMK